MRVLRNASASPTTLLSLGSLYIVVVVLTVALSNLVITRPDLLEEGLFPAVIAVAVLVPLVLLGVVSLSIVRLVRERRRGRAGSSLKTRLTLFFVLIVVLAAVPQAIVSVSFLSSGYSILFESETGEALEAGLAVALDRYEREVFAMESLGSTGDLRRLLERSGFEAQTALRELAMRYREVVAVQLFDAGGARVDQAGQAVLFLPGAPVVPGAAAEAGAVTRTNRAGFALLELTAPVVSEQGLLLAMVSTALPPGLELGARRLTQAEIAFGRLASLRPTILLILTVVYGIFISPVLLLTVLASFFFADRIMRPIDSLEQATERLADGDYSVRILARPTDDLGLLVQSFNRMVGELDNARRRAVQAEKVQAWQEIAQRLAHEVKNPLTPIRLAAERLRRRYAEGDQSFPEVLDRTVATIVREVDALSAMLNEFRTFSRMPDARRTPQQLRRVIAESLEVYKGDHRLAVDFRDVPEDLVVPIDAGQFRQLFTNLVANSLEAFDFDSRGPTLIVTIAAARVSHGGRLWCLITIADNGPGIPEEILETIFKPYVTSKAHGTGLGLAIVERIVFDHGGRISCRSSLGVGATFTVELPFDRSDEHGDGTAARLES